MDATESHLRITFRDQSLIFDMPAHATLADVAMTVEQLEMDNHFNPVAIAIVVPGYAAPFDLVRRQMAKSRCSSKLQLH